MFTLSLVTAGIVLLLAAALHDVAVRTVPNTISVLLLALGVVLRVDDTMVLPGLAATGAIFVVTTFCWLRGWMGGGDVKLYAACGMLVPPPLVLPFVLTSALAGGVLALLYLVLRLVLPVRPCGVRPAAFVARVVRAERRRIGKGGPLPYAAAIAAGAVFTLTAV